jgi:hypothetical protein
MKERLSSEVSAEVQRRAEDRCEYCLIPIESTYFGGEVDHIISRKHGGTDDLSNLAFACMPCNRYKGTDVGSISHASKQLTRFYNPRTDTWSEHFRLRHDGVIAPLTEIGEVTVSIFRSNDEERLVERKMLIELGAFNVPE